MHAGFPLCVHHYAYLLKYKKLKVVYRFEEPLGCTYVYLNQKAVRMEQPSPWAAIQEREEEIARSNEGNLRSPGDTE